MTSPFDSFLASMPLPKIACLSQKCLSLQNPSDWIQIDFHHHYYPTIINYPQPPPFTGVLKKNSTHPNHPPQSPGHSTWICASAFSSFNCSSWIASVKRKALSVRSWWASMIHMTAQIRPKKKKQNARSSVPWWRKNHRIFEPSGKNMFSNCCEKISCHHFSTTHFGIFWCFFDLGEMGFLLGLNLGVVTSGWGVVPDIGGWKKKSMPCQGGFLCCFLSSQQDWMASKKIQRYFSCEKKKFAAVTSTFKSKYWPFYPARTLTIVKNNTLSNVYQNRTSFIVASCEIFHLLSEQKMLIKNTKATFWTKSVPGVGAQNPRKTHRLVAIILGCYFWEDDPPSPNPTTTRIAPLENLHGNGQSSFHNRR